MHFDKTRYLKFMFYVRDVGPGDGAITFAKENGTISFRKSC